MIYKEYTEYKIKYTSRIIKKYISKYNIKIFTINLNPNACDCANKIDVTCKATSLKYNFWTKYKVVAN